MKFEIRIWKIKELYQLYTSSKLNLNPPYQRKFIWSVKDQKELVNSINKNYPLPNFFILKKSDDDYEMVDGQQRSRTIFQEIKHLEEAGNPQLDSFSNYDLSVTIITELSVNESIQEFYSLVNKSGLKLNRPELNKAEYFDTEFLKLNQELASLEAFTNLQLFTLSAKKRMNNVDFVSELTTLLMVGPVDKKKPIDKIYSEDITPEQSTEIKYLFTSIIEKINILNQVFSLKKTRYRQRNDFYTLFHFIHEHSDLDIATLKEFYKIIVILGDNISPSNHDCPPLKNYALNCVSQSNSKTAREARLAFFEKILLNTETNPNETQTTIAEVYNLEYTKIGDFNTFNISIIPVEKEFNV